VSSEHAKSKQTRGRPPAWLTPYTISLSRRYRSGCVLLVGVALALTIRSNDVLLLLYTRPQPPLPLTRNTLPPLTTSTRRDLQRFVLLDEVLVVSLWPRCEEEQHLRHMDQMRNVRESAACCVPDEQVLVSLHVHGTSVVRSKEPHGADGLLLPCTIQRNRRASVCLCAHRVRRLHRENQ
jgi:hypothetical protein